jgi:hypothetical protein
MAANSFFGQGNRDGRFLAHSWHIVATALVANALLISHLSNLSNLSRALTTPRALTIPRVATIPASTGVATEHILRVRMAITSSFLAFLIRGASNAATSEWTRPPISGSRLSPLRSVR